MKMVKEGMYVSIDYTARLENGDILNTTLGYLPLEIKMGAGNLAQSFEDALMGMELIPDLKEKHPSCSMTCLTSIRPRPI